jgi:hypothetical protein
MGCSMLAKERHQAVEESSYRSHLASVRCARAGCAVKASEDLELTIDEEEFRHRFLTPAPMISVR